MPSVSLVSGATGAVGHEFVRELAAIGHKVIAIVRSEERASLLPEGVSFIISDITKASPDDIDCDHLDYVFHLAALIDKGNRGPHDSRLYEQVNIKGTRNMVEMAKRKKAKRFIYFSTIDVYGKRTSYEKDESSKTAPDSLYGLTKLEAERVVFRELLRDDSETQPVVLRLAAVYGPHMKGNYPRMVRALKKRYFVPIGKGDNIRTLVYEKDVAKAAVLAATHPDAAGEIFNVSDGCFHTVREITEAICGALGRKAPKLYLPEAAAFFLARKADWVMRLLGRQAEFVLSLEKYSASIAVNAEKIKQMLGFDPEYGLREAWAETVEEWKRQGTLR